MTYDAVETSYLERLCSEGANAIRAYFALSLEERRQVLDGFRQDCLTLFQRDLARYQTIVNEKQALMEAYQQITTG